MRPNCARRRETARVTALVKGFGCWKTHRPSRALESRESGFVLGSRAVGWEIWAWAEPVALPSLGPGHHHVAISAAAPGTHELHAPIGDRGLGGVPPRNLDKDQLDRCRQLERKTSNSNDG
jgi:hypothetical protein